MATTITVTFHHSNTLFAEHWIVKDEATGAIVIDKEFNPDESVVVQIQAPGDRYGDAYYRRAANSNWEHKSLIENGDTVDMF